MLIRRSTQIPSSEITDYRLYVGRREFMTTSLGVLWAAAQLTAANPAPHGRKLPDVKKNATLSTSDRPNSWSDLTTYNNFYEFGTDKDSPARLASQLKTAPWSVVVDGECEKKGTYRLEDLIGKEPLEERIYRHRCVEGWSMVIPWVGFPLSNLVRRFQPTSKARFVTFTSLADPAQMPGIRTPTLEWPYVEGLRLDEAMHPLTIIAVGLYDEVLPKQSGAPLRVVVPWKYGFKGAKSVVKMSFVDRQPRTSWQQAAPDYYGFYSNVNPGPTRSTFRDQSAERRIGEFLMRRTLVFNGYGDQVARLYSGLDLSRDY